LSAVKKFSVTGSAPLAEFGYSIAVGKLVNNDLHLIISTPAQNLPPNTDGEGTIKLIPLSNLVGDLELLSLKDVVQVNGTQPMGRFGHKILTRDLDHDGLDEIIVGEALAHMSSGVDSGIVHILKGSKVTTANPWDSSDILYNDIPLSRFGSTLKLVELPKSTGLLVSAPRYNSKYPSLTQTGAVYWYDLANLN
jgi:hypothetical protein